MNVIVRMGGSEIGRCAIVDMGLVSTNDQVRAFDVYPQDGEKPIRVHAMKSEGKWGLVAEVARALAQKGRG